LRPAEREGIGWRCRHVGDASVVVEHVDLLQIRWGKGVREERRVKEERIGKLRRNLAHRQ
jgi:hypothetical protein